MAIINENGMVIMTEKEFLEVKKELQQNNLEQVEEIILQTTNKIHNQMLIGFACIALLIIMLYTLLVFGI
jgi:hypothetical protein